MKEENSKICEYIQEEIICPYAHHCFECDVQNSIERTKALSKQKGKEENYG